MTGKTTSSPPPSPSPSPPPASSSDLDSFHVWDGILTATGDQDVESKKTPLKWEGTIVSYPSSPDSTKIDAPRRGAFDRDVESEMRFELAGDAVRVEKTDQNGTAPPAKEENTGAASDEITVYRATLKDAADDDKDEEKEGTHELLLRTLRWTGNLSDQTVNLIFSRGTSSSSANGKDKRAFIAAGWMRVGNRLTLGRRYLSEDDIRAQWSLEELREAVVGEICAGDEAKGGGVLGKARIPPWQCSIMGSKMPVSMAPGHQGEGSNKRRKVEKEEGGPSQPCQ